jgi:hypothetical protein
MPQATIKLQQAPAPVAAKKPMIVATSLPKTEGQEEAKDLKEGKAAVAPTETEGSAEGGVPAALLMAAAALALVAFGVQVWLFIS